VSDAFPIWDREARKVLRRAVDPQIQIDPNIPINMAWKLYGHWINTIWYLVCQHTHLLNQIGNYESPVRTIDKALWIIGNRL
jgi:hypothetical protein